MQVESLRGAAATIPTMIDSERSLFVRQLRELYHLERELESLRERSTV